MLVTNPPTIGAGICFMTKGEWKRQRYDRAFGNAPKVCEEQKKSHSERDRTTTASRRFAGPHDLHQFPSRSTYPTG